MKEEIIEWKKMNGNVTYSTKELIQAVHIKLDKINDDLNCKTKSVDCIRHRQNLKNMIIGVNSLILALLGALATYIFMR